MRDLLGSAPYFLARYTALFVIFLILSGVFFLLFFYIIQAQHSSSFYIYQIRPPRYTMMSSRPWCPSPPYINGGRDGNDNLCSSTDMISLELSNSSELNQFIAEIALSNARFCTIRETPG